jgi:hypothetical protein
MSSITHLPDPPGAVHVGNWHDAADGHVRRFTGQSWSERPQSTEPDIGVQIVGTQYGDGSAEHMVRVVGCDDPDYLTIGEARQLSRALIAACNQIEP